MDPERDYDWLARYFAGEFSEVEEAELLTWAAADPLHKAHVDEMRRLWETAGEPGRRWNAATAWSGMWEVLSAERPPRSLHSAPSVVGSPGRRSRLPTVMGQAAPWAIAACLAGLIVIGLVGGGYLIGGSAALGRVVEQQVITEKGERARVRLLDGTHVTLGPGSRLAISARFGDSDREVRLSGNAYFDVTPDPDRPFRVYAAGTVTQVLGTAFNLRAYDEDAGVQVVVAEGQVRFRPAEETAAGAVLKPGDMGELTPAAEAVVTRRVDLDQHLGWREGRLSFDNAPLGAVAREIERWYGVPVRVDDSAPASLRVTASFRDQPIEEVIEVIAASLGLGYTRVGQVYVFRKGERTALATR